MPILTPRNKTKDGPAVQADPFTPKITIKRGSHTQEFRTATGPWLKEAKGYFYDDIASNQFRTEIENKK